MVDVFINMCNKTFNWVFESVSYLVYWLLSEITMCHIESRSLIY